jgi:hypothetical protein
MIPEIHQHLSQDKYPKDAATGLTLPLSRSLGLQDLDQHRAMIAFELEVLAKKFDKFGWDRDRGTPAHDRLMTDWMDVLQDYPLIEVQAACKACVIRQPSRMPNEGDVLQGIMEARRMAVLRLPRKETPQNFSKLTPDEMARKRAVAESRIKWFRGGQ